ncbi:MAG: hypothetical protein OXJ36_10905 [bacterium]|nr:hypothetical protein [bacterium]
MFDIVVSGGFVVEGTGAPGRNADVGVNGDRIAAIGNLRSGRRRSRSRPPKWWSPPASSDIHSHSEFTLLVDPRAQSQIYQGVTTELVGNCGHGCFARRLV